MSETTTTKPGPFLTSSPNSRALRERAAMCAMASDRNLLLDAADEIDALRDALFWCAGSPSFQPGGEAEEGWKQVVWPLMVGT